MKELGFSRWRGSLTLFLKELRREGMDQKNLLSQKELFQQTKKIPWAINILIVFAAFHYPWMVVPIIAPFTLRPIFSALASAAPEASKMVLNWRKVRKDISKNNSQRQGTSEKRTPG